MKRQQYDNDLKRQKSRKAIKKIWKNGKDFIHNLKSRIQLFIARVFQRGEMILELQEINELIKEKLSSILHIHEHFALLPSIADRISLLHEILWRHKMKIISPIVILSCL